MHGQNLIDCYQKSSSEILPRFWEKVDKGPDCWEWKSATYKDGYGSFGMSGLTVRAHRLSYLIHKGNLPSDLCVCHHCDNRLCVNPDHLFLGTNADNLADMRRKGREAKGMTHGSKTQPEKFARGERIAQSKLSKEEVLEIRRLYKSGMTQRQIGKLFGVNPRGAIWYAIHKTWRHL